MPINICQCCNRGTVLLHRVAKQNNSTYLSKGLILFLCVSLFSPQLKSLSLPDCWIKDFFMAHMYTELQMIKEALQKYQNLIEAGFSKSTYIISQIAVAYHNIRGLFCTLPIKMLLIQRLLWGSSGTHSPAASF